MPGGRVFPFHSSDGLRTFQRMCPHLGIDLVDGHHDESRAYCAGHGMTFSLEDGRSRCASFALLRYTVTERDATVYLSRSDRPSAETSTAE